MKTIKILFLAGFTLMNIASFAQKECNDNPAENFGSDEAECRKSISLYGEYLRQGAYEDAIKYWRSAYKFCPEFKPSLYINGQIIYKHFIDEEKDEATKEKLIDTLQGLYEQQIKIFGDCPDYYESFGTNMLKYRQKKPNISHDAFKKYIEMMTDKSSAVSVYGYYTTLYILYRNNKVDCNAMVDEYMRLNGYLDIGYKDNQADGTLKLARETMDKYAAGCLSCDKLMEIYTKKFDALPAEKDAQLKELSKMSDMLSKKECSGDLVDKIAEKMYELEPNHQAAFALANSAKSKGKNSEALKWTKEAIDQGAGSEELGKYYLMAASLSQAVGNCSSAKSYANQAIGADKDGSLKCDAYKVLAACAAANQCGENDFERRFAYCLALDYLDKAKAAGCNVSSLYASYLSRCPSKNDAFTYGKKEGDAISVCGESTKLRIAQ